MQTSVVILAAGLGTRMKSALPKVLHRAGGAPLLGHVLRAAAPLAPPERTVAVVGHKAELVRAEFAGTGIRFETQARQLGTADALRSCAHLEELRSGRILLLYGDVPLLTTATLERLLAAHSTAATVITANLADPTGYGRILRTESGDVAAIVEQKAATEEQKQIREINSGIYCFEAALLWPYLEKITPNPASGEYYLTDLIELLRADGHQTRPLLIDDPAEILGINTRVELAEVDSLFRARKVRQLMLGGVTIERPETVTVDLDVEVGQDTVIESFVQLRGRTKIGANCHIGASSILENATLADEVQVFPFCSISDSSLGEKAHLGPYARLRMNSTLEPGAHVGNFVELKKTRLGAGSKSMHLAYLGDSTIGAKVNIGAGTITCNYDGKFKHPTTIGDGAFIGSNSTLVAPVEIEAGAYVAAASAITKQVPADALALGRAQQVVKEGWARRRREKQSETAK